MHTLEDTTGIEAKHPWSAHASFMINVTSSNAGNGRMLSMKIGDGVYLPILAVLKALIKLAARTELEAFMGRDQ